jgi:hypothetical protein
MPGGHPEPGDFTDEWNGESCSSNCCLDRNLSSAGEGAFHSYPKASIEADTAVPVSSQPVFFSLLDLIDGVHARIPIVCQRYKARRFLGNRRGPSRRPQLRR